MNISNILAQKQEKEQAEAKEINSDASKLSKEKSKMFASNNILKDILFKVSLMYLQIIGFQN